MSKGRMSLEDAYLFQRGQIAALSGIVALIAKVYGKKLNLQRLDIKLDSLGSTRSLSKIERDGIDSVVSQFNEQAGQLSDSDK